MSVNCFFFVTLGLKQSSGSTGRVSGPPAHGVGKRGCWGQLSPSPEPSRLSSLPPGEQGDMDN